MALTFGALALVCLMAWSALRLASRRLSGSPLGAVPLCILARCPVGPRRSFVIVRASNRCFLVGIGDGPMALLAELEPASLPAVERPVRPGAVFGDVLARVLRRRPEPEAAAAPSSGAEEHTP